MSVEIGKELKLAREEQGLTLSEVAEEIRISEDKLKALEEGNFDYFPAQFYAKSFLKSYAGFLGVNINVDNSFFMPEKEDHLIIPVPKENYEEKPGKRVSKNSLSNMLGIAIILSLIIYGSVFLINENINLDNIYKFISSAVSQQKEETPSEPQFTKIMIKGVTKTPTWVRVVSDGKLVVERILPAETAYYWEADESMKIKVGYVGGIDIFYRNNEQADYKEVDIAQGSHGNINEIEFIKPVINESGK